MNNLNNIPNRGAWTESTSKIDQNFMMFEEDLNQIEDDYQKCKGLFPSLQYLTEKFPNPDVGSWAYVGDKLPAPMYVFRSPEGWTNTGKSGGGNLDPSIYANSEAVDSAEDLYSIKCSWICGFNNGNWSNVENNELGLNLSATYYTFRLSGLIFGEVGELLEPSITDPYLHIFKKGSFVSMNLTSSDGVSKDYDEDTLSWTIDDTFYKKEVSGEVQNRLPVNGDTIRATLKFMVPGDSDIKIKGIIFKFIS